MSDGSSEEAQERKSPYVIEGARSARSRCKSCKRKIDKGSLRIGILIEGPFGPGYLWHHLKCAARRQFERVEEAYSLEAWKQAKDVPKRIPPLYTLRQLKEQAEESRRNRKQLPYAELAPSGRSKCRHCGRLIEMDTARVVLGREVEFGRQVRTSPINVHPRCVGPTMEEEDCATSREGFVAALRANSTDLDASQVEEILSQVGDLG